MPRSASERVTIADVARESGVSTGTVSKALSGKGQLRPETRRLVLATAAALGFSRTTSADVSGQRTYTIGVLSTDRAGRFTLPLLEGAEDALGAGEVSMLLCESRNDPIREKHYLRLLRSRRVDGLIITGRSSDIRPSLGRDFPIPTVYALVQSDSAEDFSVLHDDERGASLAIQHLVATGRRKIALIAGAARHVATQNRERGARSAIESSGAELVLGSPIYGEWSEKCGRDGVATLLRGNAEFDGIFCFSDQIARGALDALRENGIDVPSQVGVIGVDNWDVMAEASRPPLTTIDLNLSQIGYAAAKELLRVITEGDPRKGIERVRSDLVRRASTEVS